MEEVSKNKLSKREWIEMAVAFVLAAGVGVTAGFLIKRYTTPAVLDIDKININPYLPDTEDIINRYSKDKDLTHFSDAEVINIAQETFKSNTHFASVCKGNATSGPVLQRIRSFLLRNETNYVEESISSSTIVNLAQRAYEDSSEKVKKYSGKVKGIEEGEYSESGMSELSKTTYKESYGKNLCEVYTYLISDKTVKNSTRSEKDGIITIEVDADPVYSTYFYVHQMKSLSDLASYPTFSKVNLKYTISKADMCLTSLKIDESYYAMTKMRVGSNIKGDLTFTYVKDYDHPIPDLNTKFDYDIAKGDQIL